MINCARLHQLKLGYGIDQGCPYLAGSRPKNLGPKTTKGRNSKLFKFNHFLDNELLYFNLLVCKINKLSNMYDFTSKFTMLY